MSEFSDTDAVRAERRLHRRVQDAVGLTLRALGESVAASPAATAPTHKVSLSGGGVAFSDSRLLEPGETLEIVLTLFPAGRAIVGEARVVLANEAPEVADGDRPTYRLLFTRLDDADRSALLAHVEELSRTRPIDDA